MLAASSYSSQLSSPKLFFRGKIQFKFEVVLQKIILPGLCESKEIKLFFYRKSSSSRKRGNPLSIFPRNSFKYSNDQRGINLTATDDLFCLKLCGQNTRHHYSAELTT